MANQLNEDSEISVELHIDSSDEMWLYPQYASSDVNAEKANIPTSYILGGEATHNSPISSFSLVLSNISKNDPETIAVCKGIHIDEWSVWNEDTSMTCLADDSDYDIHFDAATAFKSLEKWREFVSFEEDENTGMYPCCIYIARLFVEPAYRQQKIASAILEKLPDIFMYKCCKQIRYACIIVKSEEQDAMPKESMESIMIKTIEDAGFVPLPHDSDLLLYVKKYN